MFQFAEAGMDVKELSALWRAADGGAERLPTNYDVVCETNH
jgi:hypothetical protein